METLYAGLVMEEGEFVKPTLPPEFWALAGKINKIINALPDDEI